MSIFEIHEDENEPDGGYAFLKVNGAPGKETDAVRLLVKRPDTGLWLSGDGWGALETGIVIPTAEWEPGDYAVFDLGPRIVNSLGYGELLIMELPDLGLQENVRWPLVRPRPEDIPPKPEAARREELLRRGFNGTRRRREEIEAEKKRLAGQQKEKDRLAALAVKALEDERERARQGALAKAAKEDEDRKAAIAKAEQDKLEEEARLQRLREQEEKDEEERRRLEDEENAEPEPYNPGDKTFARLLRSWRMRAAVFAALAALGVSAAAIYYYVNDREEESAAPAVPSSNPSPSAQAVPPDNPDGRRLQELLEEVKKLNQN